MEGDGVEGSDSVTAGGGFLLLFDSSAGDTGDTGDAGDIGAVQCGTVYTIFSQTLYGCTDCRQCPA